jgi:hypothetical protein
VPFAREKQPVSPYINRFLQPDSLIPNPANPQSLNRFGYVLNNPIRFNDPTGHVCEDPEKENAVCFGSGTTRVGNRMIRGNDAELGKAKNSLKKYTLNILTLDKQELLLTLLPELVNDGPQYPPIDVTPLSYFGLMDDHEVTDPVEAFLVHCQTAASQGQLPPECVWRTPVIGWDPSRINGINLTIDSMSFVASFVYLNWATQTTVVTPKNWTGKWQVLSS